MTVIVKHNKTNSITDWTQAQLDEQIALGNFPSGTTLANIVLPSDWNNDHTLTGLGTMAEQDATAVAITGGTINNTTIGATTATTGKFTSVTTPSVTATTTDLTLSAISTGAVKFNTLNGEQVRISDSTVTGQYTSFSRNTGQNIQLVGGMGTTNLGLYATGGGVIRFFTESNLTKEQFRVGDTASAVNYVQVSGAATTAKPVISAQGSDANITLALSGKGGGVQLYQNGTSSPLMFEAVAVGSAVNYFRASPSITAQAVPLSAQGTDTNISMAFQPKGTGAIDLAAGSSGVNISNGGTVTALTRSGQGFSYTSIPSLAISAPTTAGGVQATATPHMFINTAPVTSGGTGYTVGNVLTVVGGTPTGSAATLTVAAVSSGVITSVTSTNFAQYSALPTSPISVTGGSGSGATFTPLWGNGTTFTITNAGSGYIEQPTVTFSGGGGSGAAAYATVGSATIFRSLAGNGSSAQSLSFHSSSGESLRVTTSTTGGTSANFIQVAGGATGNGPRLTSTGSDTDVFMGLVTKGAGAFQFLTNSGNEQMRVSHTASAVNYVQVTGAATTGTPVVQAQGSDTNVSLAIRAKGGGNLFFQPNNLNQFAVTQTASAVNYLQATGSAAGSAPAFSVAGTDTNIDLALTPKGTGLVRFGTYVAGALLATGYINIKAADGTTYKVLVST